MIDNNNVFECILEYNDNNHFYNLLEMFNFGKKF